jgi:5-deoxy-glucuronate isomerase
VTLHLPSGSTGDGGAELVRVTPATAGWEHTGLRVLLLGPGEAHDLVTGDDEAVVLPLRGGAVVECEGRRFALDGRTGVFDRVTDFAYLPRDTEARITAPDGGEFAVPLARSNRRLDPAYGPAEAVPVEVRGAGRSTRQVNNFCAPGAFETDKLCAVEVLTPDGNWSSYPPHKHDEPAPGEAVLEEIYYFRLGGGAAAFGLHRTYTADREIDETVTVRDGDAFLIPRGYHGPSVAAPGYPMYYLNVLAGPAAERTMAFRDDPDHHWVRDSWADQAADPRVPLTTAAGRTDRGDAMPWEPSG